MVGSCLTPCRIRRPITDDLLLFFFFYDSFPPTIPTLSPILTYYKDGRLLAEEVDDLPGTIFGLDGVVFLDRPDKRFPYYSYYSYHFLLTREVHEIIVHPLKEPAHALASDAIDCTVAEQSIKIAPDFLHRLAGTLGYPPCASRTAAVAERVKSALDLLRVPAVG